MTTPPPGMYPPQPVYGQQLLPGWEQRTQGRSGSVAGGPGSGDGGYGGGAGDGPLSQAFDFSFSTYASLRLVKIIYTIFIVLVAVGYLGAAIPMLLVMLPLGIAILVVGWIPALLVILSVRVGLEVTLATIRTAIDTRALRSRYVGPAPAE